MRCSSKTKLGKRCKRKAKKGRKSCGGHKGAGRQAKSIVKRMLAKKKGKGWAKKKTEKPLTTREVNWLARNGWSSSQITRMSRAKARRFIARGKPKTPGARTKAAAKTKRPKGRNRRRNPRTKKSVYSYGVQFAKEARTAKARSQFLDFLCPQCLANNEFVAARMMYSDIPEKNKPKKLGGITIHLLGSDLKAFCNNSSRHKPIVVRGGQRKDAKIMNQKGKEFEPSRWGSMPLIASDLFGKTAHQRLYLRPSKRISMSETWGAARTRAKQKTRPKRSRKRKRTRRKR